MRTRIFNLTSIAILLGFIVFVTAFLFLGTPETFAEQLTDSPEYFFKRAAGGFVIGLFGCMIIGSGNLLLRPNGQADRLRRTYNTIVLTLALSAICSIIGTAIFFYL